MRARRGFPIIRRSIEDRLHCEVAAAIVGGAIIGGVASGVAGNEAADAQTDAARAAGNTELTMDARNRADLAPYREVGGMALSQLANGLGIAAPRTEAQRNAQQPVVVGDASLPAGTTTRPLGGGRYEVVYNGQTVGNLVPGGKNGRFLSNGTPLPTLDTTNPQALTAPSTASADTAGGTAFGDFNRDFTLADFQKDPGYQFRMDEGEKGLERSAAATTGVLNGGTLKALQRYGQDYASGEYSNAYARFNNDRTQRFNRLSALAGTGQTATNTTATLGTNAANNIAETQLQTGNVRAANAINTGNAINGATSSLGQFYLQQQYMGGYGRSGGQLPMVP